MPSWPRCISPSYYYGQIHPQGNPRYFEGFQNDSLAGSSIKFGGLSAADTLVYYNGQGTQVTSGVWNSAGLTVAEAWSDGNTWAGAYLDSSDDKLYLLVRNTSTSPDKLRMTSVDKDGTVVLETAEFQVTNTAFEAPDWHHSSAPKLYRVGMVDGTGNFRYDVMNANTDDDDHSAPFDGCRIEINTSGGTVNSISANTMTETSDGILPSNFYTPTAPYDNMMGPTDNNIVGGPFMMLGGAIGEPRQTGTLVNMTTGNSSYQMPFGTNCPFAPQTANLSYNVMHWNGNYRFFGLYTYATPAGGTSFDRGEFHNFMDELAVFYGIL